MKKIFLMLAILTVWIGAYAQTSETKVTAEDGISEQFVSLRLAGDLVRYGYAKQEALPLIQALQIMAENPAQLFKSDNEKANHTKDDAAFSMDYSKILADAKEFAGDNEHLLALIATVEATKVGNTRGAMNGPRKHESSVKAKDSNSYEISFAGGYYAEIMVVGDAGTDIDLRVFDNKGKLVVNGTNIMCTSHVYWKPGKSEMYTIKVVNKGDKAGHYVLYTN